MRSNSQKPRADSALWMAFADRGPAEHAEIPRRARSWKRVRIHGAQDFKLGEGSCVHRCLTAQR